MDAFRRMSKKYIAYYVVGSLALAAVLGEAYIAVMILVFKGELSVSDLSTDFGKRRISTIFAEKLKRKRNGQIEG